MGLANPSQISTKDFLSKLQPSGIHYLAYADKGIKHKVYYAPEQALELATQPYIAKCNTYFALASFKVEKKQVPGKDYEMCDRTNDNVDKLKALWVDVDFGLGKIYKTKQQAAKAVMEYVQASPMPKPSYMVFTGGGFHLYWAFDEELALSDWQPLGRGLRELTKSLKLAFDPQVTVDSARIMRLPGTRNVKDPANPRDCYILGGSGAEYPVDQIREALAGYTVQPSEGTSLEGFVVPDNVIQLFSGINTQSDLTSYPPFYFAHVATGCAVVASSLAREGEGDDYALWKNLLHLASFAEDGKDYIHQLSRKGKGYSAEDTESRFLESVNAAMADSRMGPTTCATFDGMSDKCQSCPLKGKIKSPAVIRVTEDEDGNAKASPEHLDPSFVDRGYTYTLVREEAKDEDSEASWSKKLILDKAMDSFRYGEDHGVPMLQFNYGNGSYTTTVEIKIHELLELANMRTVLARAGMVFQSGQSNAIQGVLVAWLTKLQKTQTARQRPAFGWTWSEGVPDGFAINGTVYRPDGTTELSGSVDANFRTLYTPKGDEGAWRKAANIMEADTRPEIQLLVSTAFSSPLMALGSDANAFTFSFYSRESGVGKSANMALAQAVWGDPVRAGSTMDDTSASVAQKLGKATSMPGYWDEIAKSRVPDFVGLMFQNTQGKTRQRLDQRGGLRETYEMTGIMVANSNDPIMDDVLAYRDGTAGLYRFFQVQVPGREFSKANYDPEFDTYISQLKNNFGQMGVRYATFIAENIPLVQATMRKVRELVAEKFGTAENERFWRQAIVCTLAGAMLAEKAGIIKLNREAIFTLFKRLVDKGRDMCGTVNNSIHDLPADIMFEYQRQLLVLKTSAPKGANRFFVNEVYSQPGQNQPVKIQLVADSKKLVIPASTVSEFCQKRGKYESQVTSVLQEQLGATRERVTLGSGTIWAATLSRVWCFVLDASKSLSPAELDKYTARVEDSDAGPNGRA